MNHESLSRRLLTPLLTLFACGSLLGCDALLGAEGRIERAQTELEAGNFAAAMADVRTALESEPENVAGRILLARVMLKLGDAATARKEFDRAIAAGADPAAFRDLHYDILVGEGRHDDVLITAAVDDDLDPQQRSRLMAAAQIGIGQYEKALGTIGEALAKDPKDQEAALIQARAFWAGDKRKEATDALDRLLERAPDYARAWLYQGSYAMSMGDPARGRQAFDQARKAGEEQLDLQEQLAVIAGLVESKLVAGDLAGAERDLAELERRAPDSFVAQYLKGRIAFARGDYQVATAELQRALATQADVPFARLLLGASMMQQGSLEQAAAELARLIADYPDNSEARTMLARLHLARNDVDSARRVLAEAPPSTGPNTSVNWLAASVMLRTGQGDEGIAILEKTARADPGNVPLLLDLARAYLAVGQPEKATGVLRTLPEGQGGLDRKQLTVIAAVFGKDPVEGKRRITGLVAESPEDSGILVTAGSYLLSIGDAVGAGDLFGKAAAQDASDTDALIGLAAVAMQAGDASRAEAHLQKVVNLDAKNERAYLALADIALFRRDRAAAIQWLEESIGTDPSAVEPRLRLAELSLADQDTVRAESLLSQAKSVARNKAATAGRIGQIYLRAAMHDKALQHFDEAAALGSEDVSVGAARALIALGRNDEARNRLESENRRHPVSSALVAMLAAVDVGQRRFDQALARVAAFERAGGAASAADEIRGDVHTASGDHKAAAAAYERAAKARPASSLAIKLFRARKTAGVSAPESSLTAWLDENPRDALVRVLLAEHRQLQGDRKAAIAQYERAVEISPDPVVLNNLAWLYYEVGDDRATGLAKRAYEAAPDNTAIADTYGWILVEQGTTAEGLRILEGAVKGAPGHPDIQYHYAAALARAGSKPQAVAALRKLLDSAPAFASRAEAEALLKSLTKG